MFRPAKFIFLRTFSQSAAHRICQPCCSSINSSNLTETTSVLSGNKRNFSDKNEKPVCFFVTREFLLHGHF